LPVASLRATSDIQSWFPNEIDAYHYLQAVSISFIIKTDAAVDGFVAFAIDEDIDINEIDTLGSNSKIVFAVREAGARTITFVIPVKTYYAIGDCVRLVTSNANIDATAIIGYEIAKSSFDKHGQVVKTFQRVLQ